ncbi:hypothetical protein QJS10_CPA05g01614 [Acorus calamus]|uniref:Uncharacterized protein n=1 Tax=Acorus calamus TaxID=4465 RepID=A0AAV9ESP6_ACOCL|nr:hypothetical protein QJS10_CPA05g01614 [Acorus calamus]
MVTVSASAAKAVKHLGGEDDDDEEEEPGEFIESAPPLRVGEEREIGGVKKKLIKRGEGLGDSRIGEVPSETA